MALSTVNVGTTANDGTGDPLRTAFQTVNTAITAVNNAVVVGTGTTTFKDDSGSTGIAVSSAGDAIVTGDVRCSGAFQTSGTNDILQVYRSGWTTNTQDILYTDYAAALGDYVYLQTPGNTSTNHTIVIAADNSFYVGNGDVITGAVTNDADNPVTGGETWLRVSNGGIVIRGSTVNVATQKTPASAGATGVKGDIAHDTNYIYVCTATNTWKRVAIATW